VAPGVVDSAVFVAEVATAFAVWRGRLGIGMTAWLVAIALSWVVAPLYSLIHLILLVAVVVLAILRAQFL
jgi:hypothetical protein